MHICGILLDTLIPEIPTYTSTHQNLAGQGFGKKTTMGAFYNNNNVNYNF